MQTSPASVDKQTFENAVVPLLPVLRARARRLCGAGDHENQDLLQDTLERALRSFSHFQSGSNPLAWLSTIMLHQFIDQRRKRARQMPLQPLDETRVAAPAPEPPRPCDELTDRQVRVALDRLDDPFRIVGTLHFFDGWSQRQISQHLNIPIGTVGTRIMRTKRKLRALLDTEAAA